MVSMCNEIFYHVCGWNWDYDRGKDPSSLSLSYSQIVAGLDEGLKDMKVGGLRRIYVPGNLSFPKGVASAPGRYRLQVAGKLKAKRDAPQGCHIVCAKLKAAPNCLQAMQRSGHGRRPTCRKPRRVPVRHSLSVGGSLAAGSLLSGADVAVCNANSPGCYSRDGGADHC